MGCLFSKRIMGCLSSKRGKHLTKQLSKEQTVNFLQASSSQVQTSGKGRKDMEKLGMSVDLDNVEASGQSMLPCDFMCQEMGVTTLQLFKLRQSWKGIQRKMLPTGVEMFVRLFKTNSELQKMFTAFKDLDNDDELRSNEALEYHATQVMVTLDDAISHIDNYDYVYEVLEKTGCSHYRFSGFTSQNFWNMKEPFLDAVKITLGDRYTDNMETIYRIAITFILETMSKGIEDAIKKGKSQDTVQDKCPKGTTPKDNAPNDNAPKGTASKDSAPKGTASKDNAPKGTASKDNAPKCTDSKDNAPKGIASKERAPKGNTSNENQQKSSDSKDTPENSKEAS